MLCGCFVGGGVGIVAGGGGGLGVGRGGVGGVTVGVTVDVGVVELVVPAAVVEFRQVKRVDKARLFQGSR